MLRNCLFNQAENQVGMELRFDIKSWDDLRMQDEIPSYLWVFFLHQFQELNLEKLNSIQKWSTHTKFFPLLFLLCWASYSIVHTRNDPIENCSKITSMQYSKHKYFRFRSRNGKRQAILTYVQAYGDCRFSRRSPQFFSSLIPF